jgi:putative methyltransferase (TIGR04325 family)
MKSEKDDITDMLNLHQNKKIINVKSIIRDLTPPMLWRSLSKLRSLKTAQEQTYIEWEYVPEGWQALKTNPNIKGWNVESVLEAYQANWPTFLKTLEGTLPFGISPESDSENRTNLMFHNLMMTYAYALSLSTRHKSSISMLDWGGAIGHYYLVTQKLVPDLEIDYHCKDVPVLAEYGRSLFPKAHFYTDETCLERQYDFVLVSGSFQYSQDWASALKGLAQATVGYLFITRLPIAHHAPPFVIVQRAYQYGYNTEYLGWCLNRNEFLYQAENVGLKLVREFIAQESPPVYRAPEQPEYWGFLFSSQSADE